MTLCILQPDVSGTGVHIHTLAKGLPQRIQSLGGERNQRSPNILAEDGKVMIEKPCARQDLPHEIFLRDVGLFGRMGGRKCRDRLSFLIVDDEHAG